MKTALITGITGQDGAYLTDLLLKKEYIVHGIIRRSSLFNTNRIDNFLLDSKLKNKKLFLHYGDLTDSTNIIRIVKKVKPDEIYNLGAMSDVHVSFENPLYTANVDALGVVRVLEAVRILGLTKKTKIYQASTSELYGLVREIPQSERTPFYPRSPYAVSKLFGYWSIVNYREAYNMFVCNGILFNHESPLRGENFITRKITLGIANIVNGNQKSITLGNLDAERDWGHAKDYVEGMYMMLQHKEPIDFVLATGIKTSVRKFVVLAFKEIGVEISFQGKGVDEKGIVSKHNGKYNFSVGDVVVQVNPKYYRPSEVDLLLGDCSRAKEILNWKPKYDLNMIIKEMVNSDIDMVKNKLKTYKI